MCDLANQNSTLLQHITFPSASYWNANLWLSLFGSTLCCAFVFNLCYIVLAQKNRKKRYNKENFNRFIIYMTLASLYLGWRTILVFFDIQSAIDSELASTWVLVASKLLVISVFASYSEFLSHISGILDIASFTVILAWAIVSICGSLIFTPEDVAISITWFNDYVLSAYLSIVYFGIFVAMCVFSIRIIMEMKEARKKTRQIKVLNLKIIFPFTCVPLLARSVFNILQPFTNKGGNPLDRLFCTLKQQGEWSQYFFVYTIFYTVAEIMPIIACSLFAFNILRNKDIIANLAQIPVVQRQNIPDQDVPVSLAASGGGIRSASTTAGVIGGLTSSETFTFEGVRRNLGRDLTLKIISAVSGGGFAAGAFISEQHAHQNISQETAANNIIRHMYNNSGYLINTDRWCSFWFDLMLIALLLLTWLVVVILTFLPFLILGVVVVVDICAMIDLQERKDRTLTILWVFLVCHAIHFVLLISARCLKSYWKPEQKFQSLKHGLERILVLLSVTFIGAAWTFAFIGITAAFPTTFQDDILKLAFILIIRISASLWTSMHNNLFSIGLFVMLLSELSAWKYFGLNSLFYVIELEYSQQSFGYFVFLAGAMTFGLDFVIHIRQNLLFWYYRYSIAKLLKVDPNVRDISADNTATKLISVTVANGWKKNDGEKSFALYSIATHNDRREGHTFRKDVDGNYQATATSAPLDLTLSTLLALSGSAFGYSNGLKEEEISVLGKLKWIQAIFGFGLGSWAQIEESSRAKVIITTLFHIAMAGISILLMMAGLNQYTDQEETLLVIAICICVGMVIIFFIVPMFSPKFAAYTFDIAIFRVINRLLGVNFMGADPAHLYISDGGHVENSGLVPLLYDILGDPQPQAQNVAVNAPIDHVVVVSDSSTDGKWRLSSIKYALRRVRNLYPNGEFRTINGGDFERQLSDFKYRRPTPKSMPDFEQFGEKCAKCLFEFELIANNKRIWIIVIKPPPVRDNQLEVSAEINNVRDNSCCKPSRRACCCSFCNFWCCCRDTEFPHISLTGQFFNQSRFKSYCEMGAVLGLLARMTINYRLGELHKNNNNNNGCHHPDDSHDNDNDNGDEEALLP